jgi:predicted GIY-YIG superfamily endonuclease
MNPPGYWTKERVAAAAAPYLTRGAFQRGSNTAYVIAYRRGWLDDVCLHMSAAGSMKRRYVYRIRSDEAREVYIGITANPAKRYAAHASRRLRSTRRLLDSPHTFDVVTGLITASEASRIEAELVAEHRLNGWRVLNVAKPGGLGGGETKWTAETLRAVAKDSSSRDDMRRRNHGAYVAASKMCLIDEIFSDHPNRGLCSRRVESGTWTIEALRAEAAKHATRRDFKMMASPAHTAASRAGVLDDIFEHHAHAGYLDGRKPRGYWRNMDNLRAEARRYATRRDFQSDNPGAYSIAWKLGVLDDLFIDHPKNGYV